MKVLILSPSEICYNPRLLKAADFFHSRKAEVTVYNTIVGMGDDKVYQSIKKNRPWRIVENDISKRSKISKLRWMYSGAVNKLGETIFKKWHAGMLFPHAMNKGYVLFPASLRKEKFDFILIHLVDSLPFAVKLKKRNGAKLIYDCQEYFKGQYETEDPYKRKWVIHAEDNYASDADIVLATTNVMLFKLKSEFTGPASFLRVRNTPAKRSLDLKPSGGPSLRLIWHGQGIVARNIRGIHILAEAVANCKTKVELFLQGSITEANKVLLMEMLKSMEIEDKVHLLPPANPDEIVPSLSGYDAGVIGELAAQDNQRLTSSNKLFEFIYAGLAVLAPDLPGLSETLNEFPVGLLYNQGDSRELAKKLDELNMNRPLLQQFKNAALEAGRTELFWENDYNHVWEVMKKWN
jgi:glycosyltransferase involved in cell wall biosynthesis